MGPSVVQQIVGFFSGEPIQEGWVESNLVLILKNEHPSKPTHFRPLSVCSVYYILFIKIIVNKIKPLMSRLVSASQSAFLKGCSTQKNILLMNEVMHSF
jgi:hypothetical protein